MDKVENKLKNKLNEFYLKNLLLTKTEDEIVQSLISDGCDYKLFLNNVSSTIINDSGFFSIGNLNNKVNKIINRVRFKQSLKGEWKDLENGIIGTMNIIDLGKEEMFEKFWQKESDNREVEFYDSIDFSNALAYDLITYVILTDSNLSLVNVDPLFLISSINNYINTFPEFFKHDPSLIIPVKVILEKCKNIDDKFSKKLSRRTMKKLNKFKKKEKL